jgi:hypothetical protein
LLLFLFYGLLWFLSQDYKVSNSINSSSCAQLWVLKHESVMGWPVPEKLVAFTQPTLEPVEEQALGPYAKLRLTA